MKILCECNNTRCNRKIEVLKYYYNEHREDGLIHIHKDCFSEPQSGFVATRDRYRLFKK